MATIQLGNAAPTIFVKTDPEKAAGPGNGEKQPVLDGQKQVVTFTTFEAPMDAVASITTLWRQVHSADDQPEWIDGDNDALVQLLVAAFTPPGGKPPTVGRPRNWKGVG